MHRHQVIAIVPAHLPSIEPGPEIPEALPVLQKWVRGMLLGIALAIVVVFGIAAWLNPYDHGQPRRMETHLQLGLPPCNFRFLTGIPCPSCGMTTSFALLVRGDWMNSLKANAVGTLLAVFCAAFIPWSVGSVFCGRPLGIRSMERASLALVLVFVVLLLGRWGLVLGWAWYKGLPF